MPAAKTITPGERFGRWTALEATESRTYPSGATINFRECRCDCGTVQFVSEYKLRTGHSRSCRCLQAEVTKKRSLRHGFAPKRAQTRIYRIWQNMLNRCRNKNLPEYYRYGGRGITVCERWLTFKNFLEDMGEPPDGFSIDRVDNNKGYYKENCAWRTAIQQARNRGNNKFLTFKGKTMTISGWAEELGISVKVLNNRRHKGWSVEETLGIPQGIKRSDQTFDIEIKV